MRQSYFVLTLLYSFTAFAATQNRTARDIEVAYLEVAELLATAHNKNGACGDVEAYTLDIVAAAKSAKNYFNYNWEWNHQKGIVFSLKPNTSVALKHRLALRDLHDQLDVSDPQSVTKALEDVILWGPARGAYGNTTYLHFAANSHVELAQFDIDSLVWHRTPGTFTVTRDSFRYQTLVEVDFGQGKEIYVLQLSEPDFQWSLIPDKTPQPNPYLDGYVDNPSECDA